VLIRSLVCKRPEVQCHDLTLAVQQAKYTGCQSDTAGSGRYCERRPGDAAVGTVSVLGTLCATAAFLSLDERIAVGS
jgi:hypothetical protein